MSHCKPIPLVEGANYCVSQCRGCKRFGLHYHHIMIGFDPKDFYRFCRGLARVRFEDHVILFPDQSERIIVQTPQPDIQLNLRRHEFELLCDVLQQSILMLEVKALI
ncbi:hypothetical protein BFP72_18005 [Reichenbachiella sp. 5M10]|uniref:DUF6686 family protein n=1 Tax=Reichenbachiella sp. 5M10 TaxID=1889772 RepID=UPI000C1535F0|nr:DUF6686 family protein [Reichenbachiella sp. 5M10]PIB37165.1 hypothetical protein BFP72_18005 [Reichenbachiella sp. 5M10]